MIDFDIWPPAPNVYKPLSEALPDPEITAYDDGQYLVQLSAKLTYEFVTSMQTRLSQLTTQFGGNCESWGVWGA